MGETIHSERLIQLESTLMHLQREFEQLGQVVWRQQAEIVALKQEVARLNDEMVDLADPAEVRDPLAEKPPHY